MSQKDEFYIGYQSEMPKGIRKFLLPIVILVFVLSLGVASVLVLNQGGFPRSNFELGNLSELTGIYTSSPIPMLKIDLGVSPEGKRQYESVMLIGFGKFSALPTIQTIEKAQKVSLEGKEVTLKGTYIFYDGKKLFELTPKEASLVSINKSSTTTSYLIQNKGNAELKGEIIDPKCYFGVMKPGEGKAHRSCASRCLAGGIPPVFKVNKMDGTKGYYILEGADYEALKPYIGRYVKMKGTVTQYDDWMVLNTTPNLSVQPLTFNDVPPMCTDPLCAEF